MTFVEAAQPWRDLHGLVGLQKNPPTPASDNGILFTATYMVMARDEPMPIADKVVCRAAFENCRLEDGVFARFPGSADSTKWDDYTGLAAIGQLCAANRGLAQELYVYGEKTGYKWGGDWLGRFPDFKPLIKHCAGRPLNLWDQAKVCVAILWDAWFSQKTETSGKCMQFLKQEAFRGSYPLIDLAIRSWCRRMTKMYGSPAGLYSIYFAGDPDGTPHPFVQYAPKSFNQLVASE